MDAWIPVTLLAATAQTVRFGLQKQLKATALSTAGATYARFLYSAPLVAFGVLAYSGMTGQSLPGIPTQFWIFALTGGTTQILATMCVLTLFAHRNFAVGITFKKTETLMAVGVGMVILGDRIAWAGLVAIVIGLAGTLILSDPPGVSEQPWRRRIFNRAVGLGLASGLLFACSGVGYRGASLSLIGGDVVLRAIVTLACVAAAQSIGMAIYMRWRQPGEITRVLAAWRVAGLVGLTSMIGSACWFVAFTLQNVAYVNALGQIEMVLSLALSVFIFKEHVAARELLGGAFILVSIVALVLVV